MLAMSGCQPAVAGKPGVGIWQASSIAPKRAGCELRSGRGLQPQPRRPQLERRGDDSMSGAARRNAPLPGCGLILRGPVFGHSGFGPVFSHRSTPQDHLVFFRDASFGLRRCSAIAGLRLWQQRSRGRVEQRRSELGGARPERAEACGRTRRRRSRRRSCRPRRLCSPHLYHRSAIRRRHRSPSCPGRHLHKPKQRGGSGHLPPARPGASTRWEQRSCRCGLRGKAAFLPKRQRRCPESIARYELRCGGKLRCDVGRCPATSSGVRLRAQAGAPGSFPHERLTWATSRTVRLTEGSSIG